MGHMNRLDLEISSQAKDKEEYDWLKRLINGHLAGEMRLNELPDKAQDILEEWETLEQDMNYGTEDV